MNLFGLFNRDRVPVRPGRLFLNTHQAPRPTPEPPGRLVPASRPVELPPPAVTVRESPLDGFDVALATPGTVTFAVAGNFLRFNNSQAGSDALDVRLRNGQSDTTHRAVSMLPGMRIKGRTFTHVEVTVPAGLTGTAEFIYTTNPPGDEASDLL